MTTHERLPEREGEWIDRTQTLAFKFEGRKYQGYAGDMLSSALWANGVRMLGRSFKYHRPRGIYSMANHDANNLFERDGVTLFRADVTPLQDGMACRAVNTHGGLRKDSARFIETFSRFMPVGFYYKAFHTPRSLFPFWERKMRGMAGLGAVDRGRVRLRTPKSYSYCDVLVVGGGPAGLTAAVAAAERGAKVILVDENPHLGGSLGYQRATDPGTREILHTLRGQVAAQQNIDVRTSTQVAGYYADHWAALVDRTRLSKTRARCTIFATGCYEQPAVFRNNDLPGIMLASGAQRLIHRYRVKPFHRAVVLAANTDGYRAALDLHDNGVDVAAIVDLRGQPEASIWGAALADAKIPVHQACAIYEAIPRGQGKDDGNNDGEDDDKIGVSGVVIAPISADGALDLEARRTIVCDGVAMSVGWAPADGLLCQSGTRMIYATALGQFVPHTLPPGIFAAGRVNGVFDRDSQLADGRWAGAQAAAYLSPRPGSVPASAAAPPARESTAQSHAFPVVDHPKGKNFVDFDEDVQVKDIAGAVQEGYDNVELLKRYSTFGMGPSQGKVANTNCIRVLAKQVGKAMDEIGSPTARPFVYPVPLSHLGGRGFDPHRHTALHQRHVQAGATFMPAGAWQRPAWYRSSSPDRAQAIHHEVEAVRKRVAMIDVSTLGKIEVSGPDAATFIESLYTARFAKMKVGTTRYIISCDESGVVVDDGVTARIADDRFYVTCTTTAADGVYREMQRWALLWRSRVVLINVTDIYAAMNLAGPESTKVLAPLCEIGSEAGLDETKFPYLGFREGRVAGVAARVMRVGFVGELGYEIHVPALSARHVWDSLMHEGARHGIQPFGVEAQRVLRLEKGHVIIGQDTDGLTHPFEAGLDWAVKQDKPFFIGQRSLEIVQRKELKRKLVGFTLPADYNGPEPKECHLVVKDGRITGRVTSVVRSPTLGRLIGLCYVHPGQAQPGGTFRIRVDGAREISAMVAKLPFYDPENARQSGSRSIGDAGTPAPSAAAIAKAGAAIPPDPVRTSPLHHAIERLRPVWDVRQDMAVPARFAQARAEAETMRTLGLCDVTMFPRIGIKGPGAAAWLKDAGCAVPDRTHQVLFIDHGGLVARLGGEEFLIEDGPTGAEVARLQARFHVTSPGTRLVPRQDASVLLTGDRASTVLAEICGYDFSKTESNLIYSRFAGVSCAILERRYGGARAFQLWIPTSYAEYLFDTLLELMRDMGGCAIGMAAVFPEFFADNNVHAKGHSQ